MRLAEIFKAFKVRDILGYAVVQNDDFKRLGGRYESSIASLFLHADIIIIAVPLTPDTRGMISERLMGLLEPGNLLVNVARASVLDQAALAKLLKAKKFSAALDVFMEEPLPADDLLRQVPRENLLMTPHIGFQSPSSMRKRFDITIKNILAFFAGQPMNRVA